MSTSKFGINLRSKFLKNNDWTCVPSKMGVKLIPLRELFAAKVTGEWFLAYKQKIGMYTGA